MAKDIHVVVDGCQIIYSFLMQQDDTNAAQLYKQRAENHYEQMLKARQERECIQTNDKFQHHGLSHSQLNSLCQQLSGYTQIKTVYLVQKTVEHFPEKPLYILGVKRKVDFWGEADTPQKNSNLVQQLSDKLEFHHSLFFLILTGEYANFEKPLRKVPDAMIYKNHQK